MLTLIKHMILFPLILIAGFYTGLAYEPETPAKPETLEQTQRLTGEVFVTTMQADGSPYLHDDWVKGDLKLRDSTLVEGQDFRYNGYLDELIWRQPRTLQSIKINKETVSAFTLYPNEHDTLVFRNINIKPWYESDELNLYAQILYKDEVTLVAHQRIRRTGETHRSTGGRIIARPRIEHDPVYYFVMPDGEAREISRKSRRAISRLFPDHRREVRSALRREAGRIDHEADLINAAHIINQLDIAW